jgi:hypothetical protein
VEIVFGVFSSFAWQRGTLQLIAIHLITLNILEFMQIAIIQTEAADFVKINICVILNFWPRLYRKCLFEIIAAKEGSTSY